MSEMVERVAGEIALAFAASELPALIRHGELTGDATRAEFHKMARAALKALREPTSAMEAAFSDIGYWDDRAYRALIDAALEESET